MRCNNAEIEKQRIFMHSSTHTHTDTAIGWYNRVCVLYVNEWAECPSVGVASFISIYIIFSLLSNTSAVCILRGIEPYYFLYVLLLLLLLLLDGFGCGSIERIPPRQQKNHRPRHTSYSQYIPDRKQQSQRLFEWKAWNEKDIK